MAEFDSPFQMDEDIKTPNSCTSAIELPRGGHIPKKDTEPVLEESCSSGAQNSRPPEPQNIRSRLAYLKFDEIPGTTTEEDDMVYEEDIDDKFTRDDTGLWAPGSTDSQASEPLAPPENFSPVVNQIYRSSFPQPANFPFLKKLKLKSVLCLIPEDYPESHRDFFRQEGIELFQLGMSGNKEPFVIISSELITEAMKIVLNPANHPILIHCNRGKHRTGCLIGVLRRLQGWSLTIIFDEYRKFAAPKERPMDQQFIELYNCSNILEFALNNLFLPILWD